METFATNMGNGGLGHSTGQIVAKGRFNVQEALKIFANVYKGRPPLKPNKGNNGFISWLSGKGSPNSGASNKPIEITFTWTKCGDDFTTTNQELLDLHALQQGTVFQVNRRTWCAAGRLAENSLGIVELSVPNHATLNSQVHTAGTFFLINERNTHRVSMVTRPEDLRVELKRHNAPVEQWIVTHSGKDVACAGPDHPAYVTISLANITESEYVNRLLAVKRICVQNTLTLSHGVHSDQSEQVWVGQITCYSYTQLKHAGREFANLGGVVFHPPHSWPQGWQFVKRTGSGGRDLNPQVPQNQTNFKSEFAWVDNVDWTNLE